MSGQNQGCGLGLSRFYLFWFMSFGEFCHVETASLNITFSKLTPIKWQNTVFDRTLVKQHRTFSNSVTSEPMLMARCINHSLWRRMLNIRIIDDEYIIESPKNSNRKFVHVKNCSSIAFALLLHCLTDISI